MPAAYYIQWKSRTGVRRSILAGAGPGDGATTARNGFLRLAYRRELNAPGWFRVDLPDTLPDLDTYADKDQVEIYRRDADGGLDWYVDFHGIFRDEALTDDAAGHETFQASGPGALARLHWYHVLWDAGVANRTIFSGAAAETVLKTLVTYNAVVASATMANNRDRQAPDYGISVEADAAGGETITVATGERKNLLETLQDLQPLAGGDFDLIKTAANSWEFRFYEGQRGTDRRASLIFAKARGNMGNVRYEQARSRERTAVAVAGQGEGTARTVVVRTTAPNYSATNDIETVIEATDVEQGAADETAQLNARGDAHLDTIAARAVFAFDILPTESCRYGVHFDLGDLAVAYHPRVGSIEVQITAVEVEYEPGGDVAERISVEVAIL